jgi:hypothetical protein
MSRKPFRVQHQRRVGFRPVLLLQNRIVEAESAAEALRAAMRCFGGDILLDVKGDDLAFADISNAAAACVDAWKAELELYWKPA